jgi:hypothetical protein
MSMLGHPSRQIVEAGGREPRRPSEHGLLAGRRIGVYKIWFGLYKVGVWALYETVVDVTRNYFFDRKTVCRPSRPAHWSALGGGERMAIASGASRAIQQAADEYSADRAALVYGRGAGRDWRDARASSGMRKTNTIDYAILLFRLGGFS